MYSDSDIINTVQELNGEMYKRCGDKLIDIVPLFEFVTDGSVSAVKFCGDYVWNDDDDLREYIYDLRGEELFDEDGEQRRESLYDFLTIQIRIKLELLELWDIKRKHAKNLEEVLDMCESDPLYAEVFRVQLSRILKLLEINK